ncbi:hypothetical protein BDY24DRAFT_412767 [Mrakia frigida]|uniref:DUF952 domain-containing protein n=1 Tax=Mrakia frigida TaxID=29902 RepID=UPI003FCBF912
MSATSSESSTVLYKILTAEEHSALFSPPPPKGAPKWFGSPLDLGDGFIHTSSSKQLAGTLNRFFTSHSSIHLITIPRSIPRIEQTLKFDLASNGDKFGHLYEGLDLAEEVTEHKVVKKDAEGVWQLGDLVY